MNIIRIFEHSDILNTGVDFFFNVPVTWYRLYTYGGDRQGATKK